MILPGTFVCLWWAQLVTSSLFYCVCDAGSSPTTQTHSQTQLDHILEICNLTADNQSQHTALLARIKESGGVVKWLSNTSAIAVYPNAAAAQRSMQQLPTSSSSTEVVLRPWQVNLIDIVINSAQSNSVMGISQ
jgi:hypothetical protein